MTTDYRALCAELADALNNAIGVIHREDGTLHISTAEPVLARARAALAQPEGPTLDDIWELCEEHGFVLGIDGANEEESVNVLWEIARAVLARWGNSKLGGN